MIWSALRSLCRSALNDTSSSPKWSDAELLAYAQLGMRDISRHLPIHKKQAITTVANQKNYTLATDRVGDILLVEHPDGVFLETIDYKPGTSRYFPRLPGYLIKGYVTVGDGWYVLDNILWLTQDPDTSDDITVWYSAQRDIMALDADVVDLWDNDVEILVSFVLWKAYVRVAGQDSLLSRWKDKGRRDDNPLKPVWELHKDRYEELIAEREEKPVIQLYRAGRMR